HASIGHGCLPGGIFLTACQIAQPTAIEPPSPQVAVLSHGEDHRSLLRTVIVRWSAMLMMGPVEPLDVILRLVLWHWIEKAWIERKPDRRNSTFSLHLAEKGKVSSKILA